MSTKGIIIIAVLVGVVVGGVFVLRQKYSAPGSSELSSSGNSTILKLQLHDYAGNTVSLKSFVGKPMVLNAWAAWCPFCRKELVDFAVVQKEFEDEVVIIAINRAETLDVAKKYADELEVSGGIVFLLDPLDVFYKAIDGFAMPETIFVDSEGVVVFHKRGPMDAEEMREKIKELL